MGLRKYKEKRSFSDTPEPKGKVEKSSSKALKFVVQKHAASHLHYDFRLELDGVLLSWAVPKGPSINPEDKRLAMMVEDHPMDYRRFEGIIPKGNYGAGTVMVWDEGTYHSIESEDKSESIKALRGGLHKGHLSFILHGKKLQGEFSLIKIKSRGENAWLLIKKSDKFSKQTDITKKDHSVITDRTLEEIKKESEAKGDIWQSNRNSDGTKPEDDEPININKKLLTGAAKKKMPHDIKPMLATLVDKPFADDDWVFELKWDGFRSVAEVNKNTVKLYSRNGLSFEKKFPEVIEALSHLPIQAIFDGEVVVLNDDGKPDFQLLQQYQRTGVGTIVYYIFDVLYFDGFDLTSLPLHKRKEILKKILHDNEVLKYSDHIEEDGYSLFEFAKEKGLEGIIAKTADGKYKEGARSKEWLKIKTKLRQEAVIAGFTEGKGGRKHFGAVVLGVYEGEDLIYIGHTGGGFNDKLLSDLKKKFKPLIRKTSPFTDIPKKARKDVTWLDPKLICEVSFQEWTSEGIMRQPIFVDLREDKSPKQVKREKEKSTAKVVENLEHSDLMVVHRKKKEEEGMQPTKPIKTKAIKGKIKKVSSSKIDIKKGKDQKVKYNKVELSLTNLNKLYWKEEKISKLDLIRYYDEVAPYILPYLKDRPESLNRHPNGINAKNFFQKDVSGKVPEWINTVPVFSDSNNKEIDYLLCQDEATLIYLANLGCIEINPWHSRVGSLDYPDYVIIDLDPVEVTFDTVIETALEVKKVLDELKTPAYCKTSGSKGIHIFIPLGAKYDYDQAKNFAHLIASLVHERTKSFTSLERSPSKRKKKVYLDFLQNRPGQTIAAPYCVRPKPGATVSTPLMWEEVKKGLLPSDFTIKNIFSRLKSIGDIFYPVVGKGIELEKILKQINS